MIVDYICLFIPDGHASMVCCGGVLMGGPPRESRRQHSKVPWPGVNEHSNVRPVSFQGQGRSNSPLDERGKNVHGVYFMPI